jgi:hypothetical protein
MYIYWTFEVTPKDRIQGGLLLRLIRVVDCVVPSENWYVMMDSFFGGGGGVGGVFLSV